MLWNIFVTFYVNLFLKSLVDGKLLSTEVFGIYSSEISAFDCLEQWFSTHEPQEFLKHAIFDYLVRGTFPLHCQLKNDNSQHSNNHPVWMNQKYTFFFVTKAKKYFWYIFDVL